MKKLKVFLLWKSQVGMKHFGIKLPVIHKATLVTLDRIASIEITYLVIWVNQATMSKEARQVKEGILVVKVNMTATWYR